MPSVLNDKLVNMDFIVSYRALEITISTGCSRLDDFPKPLNYEAHLAGLKVRLSNGQKIIFAITA